MVSHTADHMRHKGAASSIMDMLENKCFNNVIHNTLAFRYLWSFDTAFFCINFKYKNIQFYVL